MRAVDGGYGDGGEGGCDREELREGGGKRPVSNSVAREEVENLHEEIGRQYNQREIKRK